MNTKIKIKMNPINKILKDHGLEKDGPANWFLTQTVSRLCDPYVPSLQGNLRRLKDYPSKHEIKYNSPYAHYHHKGKKAVGPSKPKGVKRIISSQNMSYNGAPKRGPEWEKRMMNDRGKEVCKDVEDFIKKGAK